jgi:hypothetical protein
VSAVRTLRISREYVTDRDLTLFTYRLTMLATEPKLTPPVLPSDSVNTGNNTLKLATEAEGAGDYTRAFILCNEAIEQGVSADWIDGQAFAYNMRGTYKWVFAVDLPSSN